MQYHERDVRTGKANHSTLFIVGLGLALVPVFCSLLLVQSASAVAPLNLVRDATKTVKDILLPSQQQPISPGAPQSSTTPPASGASSFPNQSNQSSVQSVSNRSQTTPQATDTPVSVQTTGELLDSVAIIVVDTLPTKARAASHSNEVATVISVHDNQVFDDSRDLLLQPSKEGWRLLGVAWYWWVLGLAAGWSLLKYVPIITGKYKTKKQLVG